MNGFNVFRARSASHFEDAIQLVKSGCSREEGFAENELSKDTAHGPHVNSLGVLVRTQQDLRGTVPSSSYVISQDGVSSASLGVKRAGQSEISDFDMTL